MKKSRGKAGKGRNQRQRQQPAQQPPQPAQPPQQQQQQQHPHPRTFKSGGCCKFKQHGDHFHAEGAEDDGTIDKSMSHVYTQEEQNVLVWLVFRNRHKFSKIKPNEPLLLMVPNVVPDELNGYNELEKNLGSQTAGLIKKIYDLIPLEPRNLHLVELCDMVNAEETLDHQIAIINYVIENFDYKTLSQVPTGLRNFSEQPGVIRTFLYFFTDKHLKFLEQAFDEFISLYKRKADGIANYTRCTHFSHNDFPKMVEAASLEITTRVIPTLDRISKQLPENSIVFDNPEKQSPGGWRIWATNQPGFYNAVIHVKSTDKMIGSKVAEALEMAFNAIGLKARSAYNPRIDKPAFEVSFSCEKLESINIQKLEHELSVILLQYQAPLQTALPK